MTKLIDQMQARVGFGMTYLYLLSQQGDHRLIESIELSGSIQNIASQRKICFKLNQRLMADIQR
jgi:hypothetical protein